MSYKIVENKFAPKEFGVNTSENEYKKTHSIAYDKCNFYCKFCEFHIMNNKNLYKKYSEEEFAEEINRLIKNGKNFKFTGGEPTLNPDLYRHLSIVKEKGGKIYLDTNGSNFKLIQNIIDNGLVDVLGISMKGLTLEEAMNTSGVKNGNLCWNNTLNTIEYASKKNVKTIVTLVCYNDVTYKRISDFANMLLKFNNVFIKINNLFGNKHQTYEELKPIENNILEKYIDEVIKKNPKLKNRFIYIASPKAIEEYDKIKFK